MDDARRSLDEVVRGPALAQIRPPYQHMALSGAAWIAFEDGQPQRAHDLIKQATALGRATAQDWGLLLFASVQVDDRDDAIFALTRIAVSWPEHLRRIPPQTIGFVASGAPPAPKRAEAVLRLLNALFDAGYRRRYWGEPSELWRALAMLLVERGDMHRASEVVDRISDAETLVGFRADKRFDQLVAANPSRFDIARALRAEIERLEQEVRAAPDVIEPISALAQALNTNDRCADALRVVDEALARAATPVAEARPYVDGGLHLPWLLDHRARALECLGRWDDAVEQRVRAARLTERGESNVSQAINLAGLYGRLGRPIEALEALGSVGRASEYGRMQIEAVRLHAYQQLGNDEEVRKALTYLREHRNDALQTYQSALVRTDQAAAAALLIERLADPLLRTEALISVQSYAELPPYETEVNSSARWQAILARPDVRAAIESVGRIESYPFLRR